MYTQPVEKRFLKLSHGLLAEIDVTALDQI